MTRSAFMIQLLESIFGTKSIEFSKANGDTVTYFKGGSFIKDCTYSSTYKDKLTKCVQALLDDKYKKICINASTRHSTCSIETYRKKASSYIFSFLQSDLDNESAELLEKNLSIEQVKKIYVEIIIPLIFDIGEQQKGKERGLDDFEESRKKIQDGIITFIKQNLQEMAARHHKHLFYEGFAEQYPLFSELNFEEDNKIVKTHLLKGHKDVQITFGINKIDESYLSQVIEIYQRFDEEISELSAFTDKSFISDNDFEDLELLLAVLIVDAQTYASILPLNKVIQYKNTACRVYNYLYGTGHQDYQDVTYVAAWHTHSQYIYYLFTLAMVIDWYKKKEEASEVSEDRPNGNETKTENESPQNNST